MTYKLSIDLTDAQLKKVRDDVRVTDTTEQPKPEPKPVVRPIVRPSSNLWDTTFTRIWGKSLKPGGFYRDRLVYNRKAAGTSVKIIVPELDGMYRLRITDVDNNQNQVARYGVLSDNRNFSKPYHDSHVWGQSGNVSILLGPGDSGRVLFFNHRAKYRIRRKDGWRSTLQAHFLAV